MGGRRTSSFNNLAYLITVLQSESNKGYSELLPFAPGSYSSFTNSISTMSCISTYIHKKILFVASNTKHHQQIREKLKLWRKNRRQE